jgi:hypothetical protein
MRMGEEEGEGTRRKTETARRSETGEEVNQELWRK